MPLAERHNTIPPHSFGGGGWIIGIFGILGLGLLYLSHYLAEDTLRFVNEGVRVQGEVIDLHFSRDSEGDGTYRPEVKYQTPEGVEYRFISSSGSNPASFSRGERVQILYLPENPQDGRIDAFFSLWGGTLICGVMGAIFALVGGGFMVGVIRAKKRHRWLAAQGTRISAEVTQIVPPEGKRHYYTISAQWLNPRDQKIHLFTSAPLRFNPEDYMKETVDIILNPANPKHYWMDTGFLPQTA